LLKIVIKRVDEVPTMAATYDIWTKHLIAARRQFHCEKVEVSTLAS